ncbi:MAG: hypothetical protein JXA93_21760 [Anaerolineae bacterium]|nr:hypothetical protein [Anaerolineae bacterium]
MLGEHWRRVASYVLIAALLFLAGCADGRSGLGYECALSEEAFQAALVSPLAMEVRGGDVHFAVAFKAGGGAYDEARMYRSGDSVQVILADTDGELTNMWVLCTLSCAVHDLEQGSYALRIEGESGETIAQEYIRVK